ncbi:hypothetical protein CRG98_018290 [Punica granatum]|uniref:Uncharacterized protein n=1 Tax=Punica granatum TaxID=22663 RepID=A0A2I0JY88_PUNGR|nr:hypothetical protein CRG98_018290 [Punica granatum]
MHVQGARRTRRVAGVHGRCAGGVRRAGSRCVRQQAHACAGSGLAGVRGPSGMRDCAAMGVLFTREHVLHPKSPK